MTRIKGKEKGYVRTNCFSKRTKTYQTDQVAHPSETYSFTSGTIDAGSLDSVDTVSSKEGFGRSNKPFCWHMRKKNNNWR
jgi:hypothetical protein